MLTVFDPLRLISWSTQASFVLDAPVALWTIDAPNKAVCSRPLEVLTFSYTTARLFALELDWRITHACNNPDVLMHFAAFVAVVAVVWSERLAMYVPCETPLNCTTAHFAVRQAKRFWPPRFAIWTTVCRGAGARPATTRTTSAGVVASAPLDDGALRIDVDRAQVVDNRRPRRDVDPCHLLRLRGGGS